MQRIDALNQMLELMRQRYSIQREQAIADLWTLELTGNCCLRDLFRAANLDLEISSVHQIIRQQTREQMRN